ncbi:MAG: hypothetical protein ACYSUM_14305 [Planctomycetota bacterium]
MRGLAAGEKGYEKYKKAFGRNFVFLNEYTTSVQAEHDPRGPEGPYRFQDRSVPVLVFKRWDGETLIQQLGFYPDPKMAKKSLANFVDKALKKNGPVVPPKALRPLLKAYDKGVKHLEKKRFGAAIRELLKIEKAAANRKEFPAPPEVAEKAAAHLKKLGEDVDAMLEELAPLAGSEPERVRKTYMAIQREYGKLPGVQQKVKRALAALPEK